MKDRSILTFNVFFIAYLAAVLCAALFMKTALWGLSMWGFLSPTAGIILAGFLLVFLGGRPADAISATPGDGGRAKRFRPTALLAGSALIFWILRVRHDLWGGDYLLTGTDAAAGGAAPVAAVLHALAFRFFNAVLIWDDARTSAALGIVSGIVFIAVSLSLVNRLIGRDDRPTALRTVSLAVLLSGGYMAVFFCYGGHVPVAVAAASLFMLMALLFLEGRTTLTAAAIVLVPAVFTHFSNLYLVPAFVYLVIRTLRSGRGRSDAVRASLVFAALWVIGELALPAIPGFAGPVGFIARLFGAAGPGISALEPQNAGGTLKDGINCLLLFGPPSAAAVMLLVSRLAARRERRAMGTVLSVLAAGALIPVIVCAGLLDGGLRWDLFASAGPALALYTVWAVRDRAAEGKRRLRIMLLIAVLGIFHTLPWILLNTSSGTAEKRLLLLPLGPGRAEMILGNRAFELNDHGAASGWLSKAVRKDSLNDEAYFMLGEILMERDEYIDAIFSYKSARDLEPENTTYRLSFAEACIKKQWFDEAIEELERLAHEHPRNVLYWNRLGFAFNHGGYYAEAIVAYETALRLAPDNIQNLRNVTSAVLNRAARLQSEGKTGEAVRLYRKATAIFPRSWRAYNGLATIEMDAGNFEKARNILETALGINPHIAELHFTMGRALEKLGMDEEALRHLRRAIALYPELPGVQEYVKRIRDRLNATDGE